MKNEMIIALEEAKLIKSGAMSSEEVLHTFVVWKQLGYSVKRGEKAIAKFDVWKYAENKEGEARIFLKTAAFFASHQVEVLKK